MELQPRNEVKIRTTAAHKRQSFFLLIFVIRITDLAKNAGLLVVYTQGGFLCPLFPGRIGI